jgi:Zn-dependent protease with chaperone function
MRARPPAILTGERDGGRGVWPLYLPLVIPALAGFAARPLAERLEPRQATWLLTSAAAALASCSTAALAVLAGFAAARAPVLAVLGHYSQSVMRRFDPIPVAAGAAAALALVGVSVGVGIIFRNRARGLAESYRRAACLPRDGIVVVPGPALDAYALPGRPGRIVVSGRLLDSLDPGRRAALIAHEQAHLAGRHHLFASVARLAAAANPMLLPVARAVEYTVERWADEHAAVVTGDRRLVAETIGQVALLASPRPREARRIALGIAGQIAERVSVAWAGPVPRRVAALLGGPPRRRTILMLASAAIVLLAGLSALEAARDLHALLELAQGGRDALHPWPPGFFPARIMRLI